MNFTTNRTLSRRTFLRGAGVSVALPLLDAMLPARAATAPMKARRMVAIYTPNGCNIHQWVPKGSELSPTLQPLAPVRQHVSILGGLYHPNAINGTHANQDNWLSGSDQKNRTISLDQLAAEVHAPFTRFGSLELSSLGGTGQIGHMNTLAWTRNGIPLPTENNPRNVFERLFAPEAKSTISARQRENRRQTSLLDAVMSEAKSLGTKLGAQDKAKLSEYLASVDELEKRIKRAEQWLHVPKPQVDGKRFEAAVPVGEVQNYLRTMYDLIVLALQTDSTRVVTFSAGKESGGFSFGEIGINSGHHALSHYDGDEDLLAKLAKADSYLVEQWAYFITQLQQTKDAQGSLLDSTVTLYGSGMSMNHSKYNLPMLMAGGAGLGLKHGRNINFAANGETIKKSDGTMSDYKVDPKRARLSNVLLTMAQKLGVEAEKFADSTGEASDLKV